MNWHARYKQQAGWTAELRAYLFEQARLRVARQALEVGCGTGAILGEMRGPAQVHGLDLSQSALHEARVHAPHALLTCGDAGRLPYPGKTFEVTCCHFLLLWVADPLLALREMKRVTRRGGSVLAMAEPDYNARRDAPAELAVLGRLQTQALIGQGADPGLGARLAELFALAGIRVVETGAMAPPAQVAFDPAAWELEWAVLEEDLAGSLPAAQLRGYRRTDRRAWECGERRLHVPTYFAWGQV
jgi:SAM-dependent methyltransferase